MRTKEYAEYLKTNGYYQGEDGHIHRPNKKIASVLDIDGEYKLYLRTAVADYCYLEKNVVWWMAGDGADVIGNREIVHVNGDKSDNRISNLALSDGKNAKESKNGQLAAGDLRFIKHLRHGQIRSPFVNTDFVTEAMDREKNGTDIIDRILADTKRNEDAYWRDTVPLLYPLLVRATLNPNLSKEEELTNAAMGLAGETGEIADAIKKHLYQGHPLDIANLIEEAGDVLYYLSLLLWNVHSEIPEAMLANMDKLKRRYPNGFESSRSVNRKD